jgi:hypothetical protein
MYTKDMNAVLAPFTAKSMGKVCDILILCELIRVNVDIFFGVLFLLYYQDYCCVDVDIETVYFLVRVQKYSLSLKCYARKECEMTKGMRQRMPWTINELLKFVDKK